MKNSIFGRELQTEIVADIFAVALLVTAVVRAVQAGGLPSAEFFLLLAIFCLVASLWFRGRRTTPAREKRPEISLPAANLHSLSLSVPNSPERPLLRNSSGLPSVTEEELFDFLQKSPSEQGRLLGTLRRYTTNPSSKRPEINPDLAPLVREKLEDLENNPAAFAKFQSSFIEIVADLDDPKKVAAIEELLERTYEEAIRTGLHAASRPKQNVEAWALRRDALDRRATREVEKLLTPEERQRFGRAFLGLMGIDLGLGLADGARHRFVTPEGGVVFPSERRN